MSVDRCELLRQVAPGGAVGLQDVPGVGVRARLDLSRCETVKIAYLDPDDTDLPLRLYPGDTLTQARVLYSDHSGCQRLLALREHGWDIKPNFHFGFGAKGLTWSTSSLSTDDYVAYWLARIDHTETLHRQDWDAELRKLIDDGIFNAADEVRFTADFRATRRNTASPRPGLLATRRWPHSVASDPDFPAMLKAAIQRMLTALGEPGGVFSSTHEQPRLP